MHLVCHTRCDALCRECGGRTRVQESAWTRLRRTWLMVSTSSNGGSDRQREFQGRKKKERGPLRQFPVEAVDDPVARQTAQTAWITIVAASIATEQAPFTLSITFGVCVYISFSPLLYGNQFPLLFLIILTQYGVKWAKFCLQRSSNPQSLFLRLSSESGVPPAR